MKDFCVIGSSISGSTIANLLNKKYSVDVFDKARGPGGRSSFKRLKDKIGFLEMSDVIADCMEKSTFVANPTYDDFVSSDEESRVLANALI